MSILKKTAALLLALGMTVGFATYVGEFGGAATDTVTVKCADGKAYAEVKTETDFSTTTEYTISVRWTVGITSGLRWTEWSGRARHMIRAPVGELPALN